MATSDHVAFCFSVLLHHLDPLNPKPFGNNQWNKDSFPLFVSYHSSGKLRGCIGCFTPLPLKTGLEEYALAAAMRDTRFSPITLAELPSLSCSVSLLIDFEIGNSWDDWEIGTHGIWIEFKLEGRKKTATYLPDVMIEQGWNHQQAIDSLLQKGGYRGVVTSELRSSILLKRYKSTNAKMAFKEWRNPPSR